MKEVGKANMCINNGNKITLRPKTVEYEYEMKMKPITKKNDNTRRAINRNARKGKESLKIH